MRLDKFIAENTGLSRSLATKVLRQGAISINGEIEKSPARQVNPPDKICFEGEELPWCEAGIYLMLHKPQGYVCTKDELAHPNIWQFFDYPLANKIHCVGRLDVDTSGLVLMTDDGQWSHRLSNPKHHVPKTYFVTLADPIEKHYEAKFAKGIMLRHEKTPTLPAHLEILDDRHANLTINEGRYHQVKRMFGALGNKVTALHRWRIGEIVLEEDLEEGQWRNLTTTEIEF